MNIIQVNHYVGPEQYCPAYRPTYLAREWVRLGHDVTNVCASHSHLYHRQPRQSRPLEVTEEDGVRYISLKTPSYRGNGPSRLINMLMFVAQLYRYERRLARDLSPDVVVTGSAHVLDSLPGYRLARRAGAKYLREVRDLWPLTLTELGGLSLRHPLVRTVQMAEDFSYRNADCVITTLPGSLEHMQRHGLCPSRWVYLPQGIYASYRKVPEPLPVVHAKILSSLRAEGYFIVGYAGSVGIANALSHLLDAAELLRDVPVAIVVVGQGAESDRLRARCTSSDLAAVHVLPSINKAAVPSLLEWFDAAYIGWLQYPIYRFGISPNKLMDYMLAAIPVIHAVNAANDLVAESGCGFSVEPECAEAIAGAIMQLSTMSSEDRQEMGKRGREYVCAHHDYRVLAQRYLDAIAEAGQVRVS